MEPDKEMLQFLISSHQPLLCCCINCNRGAAFPNISASKRTAPTGFGHVTDQLDQVFVQDLWVRVSNKVSSCEILLKS